MFASLLAQGYEWDDVAKVTQVCAKTVARMAQRPEVQLEVERLRGLLVGQAAPLAESEIDAQREDRRLFALARRYGAQHLPKAMKGALDDRRYGDFSRLLTLACDQSGIPEARAAAQPATAPSPTPEQLDAISQRIAEQLGALRGAA